MRYCSVIWFGSRVFVGVIVVSFSSICCSSTTACEFEQEFNEATHYYCWADEEQDFCETSGVYHDDTSCADLGYTHHCTKEEVGKGLEDKWTAGAGCDSSVKPAGKATNATGCGEYTDRGLDELQVKSHCQAAWSYTCEGNEQGVEISCSNLDGLTQISVDGSNPRDKCPYCD